MSSTRRQFLQISSGTLLCSLAGANSLTLPSSPDTINPLAFTGKVPVCQLMTNETSAQFAVMIESHRDIAYQIIASSGQLLPATIWDKGRRPFSPWGVDKLIVNGLIPDETYRLQILEKHSGRILDERLFRNLSLNKKNICFAIASCSCDRFSYESHEMWSQLSQEKPDVLFLVGDTVYADLLSELSEVGIWTRYCETRARLSQFRQPQLIPTLATWDDHDFGKNNANKNFHLKNASKNIFRTFWGSMPVPGLENTFGVGSFFSAGGQRFYLMDDRYYRDEARTGGMQWGADQQEWLLESLRTSSSPAWLLNGSQFFGPYKNQESFMVDYSKNFADILRKISRIDAPVVFASGDVHFSEVLDIEREILGYRTFEFTSSSIHSFALPGEELDVNPRRLDSTWHYNFLIINSRKILGGLHTTCESVGRHGERFFTRENVIYR